MGRKYDAARVFAEFCGNKVRIENKPDSWNTALLGLYHWLLNNNGMEEAAHLLWTPELFTPEPKCTKDVWNLFDTSNMGLLMGAASMSKSYTMGVRLFLEWTRDPNYTTVQVLGPSADHLERNLFSHIVRLHRNASLPMPGEVGELFIGLDRRNRASSISGVIVPIGQHKKAGRLQGGKRFNRTKPHPIFGKQSRLFIFLDEIENIPEGIWSDIDNVLSQVEEGKESAKIFGAYNPTDPAAKVAEKAEPSFGWAHLDPDKHYRWKSIRGWDVIRLDAMTCENVVKGKTIYPGLQTRAGINRIATNAGGMDSPGALSMVRAVYPKAGATLNVFQPGTLHKTKGEFIWYDNPTPVGGLDLALEGKANACFSYGLFGPVVGYKRPPSIEYPKGQTVMFSNRHGDTQPRFGLQLAAQFPLAKCATDEMYMQVVSMCNKLRIKPEHLAVDRTGSGTGVHDLLRSRWNLSCIGVNYSEGATEQKIMAEDLLTPKEEFERITTELWFASLRWAEFGYVMISPGVDTTTLSDQLQGRRYRVSGKKTKVESKQDYMGRGKDSPDEADSFTLLVHAARVAFSVVLSMNNDPEYLPDPDGDDYYLGGARIDASNRNDSLEIPL
jgi:hypothetical protein